MYEFYRNFLGCHYMNFWNESNNNLSRGGNKDTRIMSMMLL